MAFLSRARTRLRLLSNSLEQSRYALLDISTKNVSFDIEILRGYHSHHNPSQHHAYFCMSATRSMPNGESVHADSRTCVDMLYFPQAVRLLHYKTFKEVQAYAGGMQRLLSNRYIQTFSESRWDHPWSRDELAERMALLKSRRINKERLKERFKRRASFSQYSSLMPEMPLPSQPLEGVLQPRTPEDAKVASLLARSDLIITRNIEWANLLVGFEQENRYVIMDPRESLTVVGFITESSNWLTRQFLRSRRPFLAAIMDASGSVLFTVRRPIWFINSTIYAEINGEVVGFAKRRWHLWRRIYDVYLGKRQFAVVENPGFWNWTFTLKDENGNALGEIDRHFRGFGFEMLTDAGQYAIRFGDVAADYHPPTQAHTLTAETPAATHLQGIKVNPDVEAEQFVPQRSLNLLERTVTLALAISLDNDYFSRHRGFVPLPFFSEE